ncbi:alpha-glucoside transport system substrate-binding protein [Kineococcus xinjiangensis]|uniref:Alpha-glucoside transport system substrate-binding protein n=1 Tax=Kineococcus xinjiangensis TaxID=512762 RepID=A0A2S6IKE5_9ACTN|nr:ABC transporter substrate-binding protein [Kineococcus xinjiangensis]PPK94679.1 alpha-glucoside transport system substrate-binding protein [Kineococcus xinjiangensis]
MSLRPKATRRTAALASALTLGLTLAACGGDTDPGDTATGGTDGATEAAIDCGIFEQAPFDQFGDIDGKTVTLYTGIVTPEDAPYQEAFKAFEDCTGATVEYEGDKAFETQVLVRARAGNAPDIAIVPQPGLLAQLVETGSVVAAPEAASKNVDEYWGEDWKAYGTVDGTFYAPPNSANVKSLVWYSPAEFEEAGYEIPTTLDELKALSDKMVADGKTPWCAGISSGEATGWPVTDWMEDFMLRTAGPEAYDKWVAHEIPFNGPEATAALDAAGEYLKNAEYVNGGFGDVKSIATTTFQDAGLPILDGACSLHRQASFYAANWPEGTTVAEDGDVFAFYLPGETADEKPVLGGGEFITAFADRPEVQAFQTYLTTPEYANLRASLSPSGGWVSANKELDASKLTSPIDQLSAEILQDPNAVFRFDGSDMMPAAIGSNEFWKQSTNWITGTSTTDALNAIEAAWPAS